MLYLHISPEQGGLWGNGEVWNTTEALRGSDGKEGWTEWENGLYLEGNGEPLKAVEQGEVLRDRHFQKGLRGTNTWCVRKV